MGSGYSIAEPTEDQVLAVFVSGRAAFRTRRISVFDGWIGFIPDGSAAWVDVPVASVDYIERRPRE